MDLACEDCVAICDRSSVSVCRGCEKLMKFDREVVSASAAASATGSTHLHSGCDSDVTVDVELGEATELRIVSQ